LALLAGTKIEKLSKQSFSLSFFFFSLFLFSIPSCLHTQHIYSMSLGNLQVTAGKVTPIPRFRMWLLISNPTTCVLLHGLLIVSIRGLAENGFQSNTIASYNGAHC
jgi:hypothetical protein